MNRLFFLIAVALLPGVTLLAQPLWKPGKATVAFTIRNAGFAVNGTFSGFAGTVIFDPAHPDQSKLSATVETASVSTGIGARDNHIRKPDYFDAAAHPRISLNSVSISKTGSQTYSGVFDLTLKGTTRRVTVPFRFVQTGDTGEFSGSFTINRLDYKIGKPAFILGDDVTITLNLLARQNPPD